MVKWTAEFRAQHNRNRMRTNMAAGLCSCGKVLVKDRVKCLSCMQSEAKMRRERRFNVLAHYGIDGKPACHCCGESRIEFLAIDHVGGGGTQHREQLRKEFGWKSQPKGDNFYKWLIRNNFPVGFQDLCHNCNQAMGAYGYCPHQLE